MSVGAGERGRSRKRGASAGGAAASPPKPPRAAAKPKTPEALLAALAERDRELAEARERQTATAEILKVIAASPSDAQPVFDAIAASAKKLVGAKSAFVFRVVDGMIHLAAHTSFATAAEETAVVALYPRPYSESVYARTEDARKPLDFADLESMPPYLREAFIRGGLGQSFTAVPMTSLGRVVGVVSLLRSEKGSLPAHHVELLQTFADQAVIAIDNARLFKETQEALERQTATADVLKVISRSVSDVAPVFEAILDSCRRLLGLEMVAIYLVEGDRVKGAAQRGWTGGDWGRDDQPLAGSSTGQAIAERRPVHFPDLADRPDFPEHHRATVRAAGGLTVLYAPMLLEDRGIGSIVVSRKPKKPFTDKEIALAQSFADQAAIAIQNARLFEETQRALERQTATAEVLKVIAASPANAAPVFESIAESAKQLLGGFSTAVWWFEGETAHLAAFTRADPEADAALQALQSRPFREFAFGAPLREGEIVQIPETENEPEPLRHVARLRGYRANVFVPVMQQGIAVGFISVTRKEPGLFASDDVALLQTFADQAVIAIENARLFGEVQARTRDLEESLAQQTATADVLKVISRSAFDLQTVLDTLTQSAAKLCEAEKGCIFQRRGDLYHWASNYGFPDELVVYAKAHPFAAGGGSATSRAARDKAPVHIPDVLADPEYRANEYQRLGDYRTNLGVPLLRDGEPVGVFVLTRQTVRPFNERQIELVQTFADQAVIAIENARLFEEVQAKTRDLEESLAQQTATADVLKIISRSAFDLDVAALAILEASARLCRATQATLHLRDGDVFRLVTQFGLPEAFERAARANPIPVRYPLHSRRKARPGEVAHFADAWTDPEYLYRDAARSAGYRAIIVVPLMREGELVGIFGHARPEPEPFTESQIKLTQTFADQAAIAIENARLFGEVQAKTRDLEEALAQQTATSDILRVISQSPTDARPVFEAIVLAAVRSLRCEGAFVLLRDGDGVVSAAGAMGQGLLPQLPGRTPLDAAHNFPARAILSGETLYVPDWSVADLPEHEKGIRAALGINCGLWLPLMRESECVGVIGVGGTRPNLFGPKEIAQAESFRDQAMIAIENARLFNETQEALERQTATAEILRVISQSPTDARPVFERIVLTAVRVLKCDFAGTLIRDGDSFYAAASATADGLREHFDPPFRIPIDEKANFPSRAILDKQTLHLPDWSLIDLPPHERVVQDQLGAKSAIYMPLMREDECIGVLGLVGNRPNSFGPKEVAQAESFRDQALIAIENARLFNETQEALEHQRASADVLDAISKSVADTAPVFEHILEACQRLFGTDEVCIFLVGEDGMVRQAASRGQMFATARDDVSTLEESRTGQVIRERSVYHIPDALADPDASPALRERMRRSGNLSIAFAPMLWEDRGLGSVAIMRKPPRPFSERELSLLKGFADQAAIAIQNARLFNETQAKTRDVEEALEDQIATSGVLQAIGASMADAQPVFDRIVDSLANLMPHDLIGVWLTPGDGLMRVAAHRAARSFDFEGIFPAPVGETALAVADEAAQQFELADVLGASSAPPTMRAIAERHGNFAVLITRMVWNGRLVGTLGVTRAPGATFATRERKLLRTFADQAVIAIENARLFGEVQAKTRDVEESLAQQTATADVLKAISRTAFDLDTVLETLISTAVRLCDASHGQIFRRHGDVYRYAASQMDVDPAYREHERATEIRAGRGTLVGRVALENRTVEIADAWTDPDYAEKEAARVGDVRAMLGVPLMRDGEPIGAFALARRAVGAYSPRQIELVQTFADQAVIAIENARLFEEVQAKTRDLEESLAQQTATADVLKVIGRSAFDRDSVLQTLIDNAVRLARGSRGAIHLKDGDALVASGFTSNVPAELRQYLASTRWPFDADTPFCQALREQRVVHVPDFTILDDQTTQEVKKRAPYGAGLWVPLMGEAGPIGVFGVPRNDPGAFSEREIEVVQTFADQAVIAIENARLFGEVQAKTRDLEESLAQQTATADVLKVISRSAFDLQTVLDTLASSAVSLCGAGSGIILLKAGERFELRAMTDEGAEPELFQRLRDTPLLPGRGSVGPRVLLTGEVQNIADVRADPEFDPRVRDLIKNRALLGVPLKRGDDLVGAFVLARAEPGLFTDRQVQIVQTFADQAVIAIENARLFSEVQAKTRDLEESLAQQTATADVLKVISRSAFDLQPVLDALISSAVQLNGAQSGTICVREGDGFAYRAFASLDGPRLAEYLRAHPPVAGRSSIAGRVILSEEVEQVPDILADPEYHVPIGAQGSLARALIAVPLIGKDRLEGVFILSRLAPGAYAPRQVEILKTFADQAVIAIENSRLFDEVQSKTRDLEESLAQQTATADVLKVISRSVLDLDPVLQTLIDTAVRLARGSRGTIFLQRGDTLVASAFHSNVPAALREYLASTVWSLDGDTPPARAAREGRAVHIADFSKLDDANTREVRKRAPYGAGLWVPLIGERGTIGVFGVPRDEPGAFSDREIEIVRTFADQAVIAIENARLFNEVQARTRDLEQSLDDLRKAQDRLVQSEKLASLGQLTAGIAHEIKNPLNFINNFSALSRELMDELRGILDKAPLDEAGRGESDELIGMIDSNLDKVVAHGKRADSIVKNMLLHSREGSGERGATNVNAMVEEALNLAYHGARAEKRGFNVTIEKSLDPAAGEAELYVQEMTRVLLNLISNAFYATNKRKEAGNGAAYEPTVYAATRDLGHSVEIVIRDNGTGIPEDVKAKMFNPFFTTKPAGEGTGLGLSLSHDIIVKQHGGTIEVATEAGAYTAFTITLPRGGRKP